MRVERKLLTILFVDLVDSTGMVTGADPEIVRRRVARFFDHVSECISLHGGTVNHLAGDSIMAAFGIPQTHEDDAMRAIRAGRAILDSVESLGVAARVGIEAGEVLTDETDTSLATGEAINIAVRLQQVAAPNELLIGSGAYRLALGRLDLEDVGPVELKGIDRPVWAWRVLAVRDAARLARVSAPLVGRDAELELLNNTFGRVAQSGRAHLFTIYGEPGVGKSRLAREFVDGLDGATVLVGRCLPYGEGITYWPLAEMVKLAAGIADDDPVKEALEKLRASCENEAVADLLGLASGVLEAVERERGPDEIAWATRGWAEQLADAQPLVLVFEDIHWAEEPLLELLEQLAAWVREAPLMIICLARPELLDIRPAWGGGRLRATAIELEPLSRIESNELIDALAPPAELDEVARVELIEKTGGNPLFVEETIRMLAEQDGRGAGRIPDTVQALIAARIDRLPPVEKAALQRAAVIGRTFWGGALADLTPDGDLQPLLDDLLDRELVVVTRSSITNEIAYRFKHVLIQEVAYAGLSKSARAELHGRFADWVGRHAGEELLEIRATHLDRACALYAELDGAPPAELVHTTAAVLQKAGHRALARESFQTARKQLLRAAALEPTVERRYLAARAAWRQNDFTAVAAEMEGVRHAARESGERRLEGRALTALAEAALNHDADVERARELIEEAVDVLEGETDVDARFDALMVRGQIGSWLGNCGDAEKFIRKALVVAEEAGRKDLETIVLQALVSLYVPQLRIDEAEPLADEALALAEESGSIVARASALMTHAMIDNALGNLDEAEEHLEEARALFAEVGRTATVGKVMLHSGRLARKRGDLRVAEERLRESVRTLAQAGDRSMLCEAQRSLAELLVELGDVDEAERFALAARETVGPGDVVSLSTTKLSLGVVRSAQGHQAEAEALMREAYEELAAGDFRIAEREAAETLACFLRERGRCEDAAEFDERASALSAGVAVS